MADWLALADRTGLLVHAAAMVQIAGFLMRDQIRLRALVLTGNALYATYYFLHPATPLWDAMFWSCAMLVANLVMIVVVARDRRMHAADDDTLRVFGAFGAMEPGDFRRLMRVAETGVARAPVELTRLGVRPGRLHYVIAGELTIERPDRTIVRPEGALFIAEVGFLLGTPASATVILAPGGRYVSWDREALAGLMARRASVAQAVERALNRDMAEKIRAG
jgi:hypothetical protein